MGLAIEVVSGFVTNPGAAVTPVTVSPGNSLAVRSFDPPSKCNMLELWTSNAAGGVLTIKSPRLHDNVQGLRLQVPAGDTVEYLPRVMKQSLAAVDQIGVAMSGGGAEVDLISFLIHYTNLEGINANLKTWAEIQDRIVNYCGVELDLVSGATAGNYGGSRTLNQDFQNLKADVNYALLGYTCASNFGTLGITGPDTGNLRIGGPGSTNTDVTADWFIRCSQNNGVPMIPIIKANNQGGTIIDVNAVDTATSHHVSLILAQLA